MKNCPNDSRVQFKLVVCQIRQLLQLLMKTLHLFKYIVAHGDTWVLPLTPTGPLLRLVRTVTAFFTTTAAAVYILHLVAIHQFDVLN